MPDCANVSKYLEFKSGLAKGLHLHSRRTLRSIPKYYCYGIALTEVAPVKFDSEGLEPWTLMAGVGIMKRETRPSAGLGRDVVVSLGVAGLESPPVSHEAEHHSNAARVVNPVASHRINKPESLEATGFECTQRIQQDMSVKHRIAARLR